MEGGVIRVRGGTDVKWSPTWDYFTGVDLPLLGETGFDIDAALRKRGHYPEGGGEVEVEVEPWNSESVELHERGELLRIEGTSHVSNLPGHIAERQASLARKVLSKPQVDVDIDVLRDEPARSKGTGITLRAVYEKTVLGGTCLGERGKPAEEVGREAAENLLQEMDGAGALDRYAGDQVLPFVALAGGSYSANSRTGHVVSNAAVCREFLDAGIELTGDKPVRIEAR